MKNKIVYILKHNEYLKTWFIVLGSLAMRILGAFVKTDENLILFVSNTGKGYSGSPKAIYEYMKSDDRYNRLKYVWAFNEPENYKDLKDPIVKFDTIKYFITTLKAKYWVTDINIERTLKYKKKETIYLNTWHGVALKLIGNDDKNSGRYDYSNIDFLCVSGEYDKTVYTTALKATEKSFLECGMPRNDELISFSSEEVLELRHRFNISDEKIVVLYAPTWRDSTNSGKSFDLKVPLNLDKWKKELGEDYVILFRAHDRTNNVIGLEFDDYIIDCNAYPNVNELMLISDILITDYSSICFDYSLLGKPFFCYGYDYDEYRATRGTYFDANEVFPFGVIREETELLNMIKNYNEEEAKSKMKSFCKQFMEYTKGNATEVCVKSLLGE